MNDKDFDNVIRNAKFLAEHELNDDQLERLIEEKFVRARAYYEALHKREEQAREVA